MVTTYSYEAETQRLVGIRTERVSATKVLQDLRYEYDPVGNVLVITNDAEETRFWRNQEVVPENHYAYDSLYQLVSASGRVMASAVQQSSNLPDVTSFDNATYTNYTRTYTYDNAGNLKQIRHSAPASGNNYTVNMTVSDCSNRAVRAARLRKTRTMSERCSLPVASRNSFYGRRACCGRRATNYSRSGPLPATAQPGSGSTITGFGSTGCT